VRTVEQFIEVLKNLDPKEPLWLMWIDKQELVSIINDSELTDEADQLITVDKDSLSDDFFEEVMNSVDSADYVWERFNDDLRDSTVDKFRESMVEEINAQLDKDLWDTEGEQSVTT